MTVKLIKHFHRVLEQMLATFTAFTLQFTQISKAYVDIAVETTGNTIGFAASRARTTKPIGVSPPPSLSATMMGHYPYPARVWTASSTASP